MFCDKCDKDLHECVCSDIDQRMKELTDEGGPLIAKWCLSCDKHYARCRCSEPLLGVRHNGKTMPAVF